MICYILELGYTVIRSGFENLTDARRSQVGVDLLRANSATLSVAFLSVKYIVNIDYSLLISLG